MTDMKPFKAITVRQPYASLIMGNAPDIIQEQAGEYSQPKDCENRSWKTSHRGFLLIHAGMQFYAPGMVHHYGIVHSLDKTFRDLPRGVILGSVELITCIAPGKYLSEWSRKGMWSWLLKDPIPFVTPIRFTGKQGLFDVPPAYVEMALAEARKRKEHEA